MKIRVVNSIYDVDGIRLPLDMIGNEYTVIKDEEKGVWVNNGNFEIFVLFEELQILELDVKLSIIFSHYLKNLSKSKFNEELKNFGCTHLL